MRTVIRFLIIIILIVLMAFGASILVGCNYEVVDLHYQFDHVHIYETGECYKIKKWTDYENSDQIQIILEDGTILLIHSTDCALVKGTCPICKKLNK